MYDAPISPKVITLVPSDFRKMFPVVYSFQMNTQDRYLLKDEPVIDREECPKLVRAYPLSSISITQSSATKRECLKLDDSAQSAAVRALPCLTLPGRYCAKKVATQRSRIIFAATGQAKIARSLIRGVLSRGKTLRRRNANTNSVTQGATIKTTSKEATASRFSGLIG